MVMELLTHRDEINAAIEYLGAVRQKFCEPASMAIIILGKFSS